MGDLGKLLPNCIVCGQVPTGGIKDGVVVSGHFICQTCENELTSLRQDDHRYPYFVRKIKKLWL